MSTKLQRFDFGSLRDFRGPIQVNPHAFENPHEQEEEAPPPPPPPPTYDESQLLDARLAAKKMGYAEGFNAGMMQAQTIQLETDQLIGKTLSSISEHVVTLMQTYSETLQHKAQELDQLAVMVAKKVAGDALDKRGAEAIMQMISSCLPVLIHRPRVLIELHPDTQLRTEAKLRAHLSQLGYEGEIIFRAAPHFTAHDVRVDWGHGHAERATEALWQEIDTLITRFAQELHYPPTTPRP